jgi:hypothetical protein
MLKGNQLKFQRGAAAKTEGEDRNNGGENRYHAVTVRLARENENLQCFSALWRFEQGQPSKSLGCLPIAVQVADPRIKAVSVGGLGISCAVAYNFVRTDWLAAAHPLKSPASRAPAPDQCEQSVRAPTVSPAASCLSFA